MSKIPKTFRIDQARLNDLAKIQKHLQIRFATAAEITGATVKPPTDIQTLEFAIKLALETLQKEGYDL